MNDSILNTIKKMLGLDPGYTYFDTDIIIHINTAMNILSQLGVNGGIDSITGPSETWGNYLGSSSKLEMIKTYIYLKARVIFDPSASSSIQKAFDERISELESRINMEVDREVVE